MARVTVLVLALALVGVAARARAAAPRIELVTMGPGDALFSRFGHAALCVEPADAVGPAGVCYNYGTADFSTPVPLTWEFLRGRARFWVAPWPLARMLAAYQAEDRTVWVQRLPLSDAEATTLAAWLEAGLDERVRYYRYHHFHDNCTTRLRDLLDKLLGGDGSAASDGRLGHGAHDRRGPTFREYARAGFAGDLPLLLVTELFLGRPADQRTSRWDAMFLPSVLRDEVATRLGAAPVEVVRRHAPPPAGGSAWLGSAALVGGGILLAVWVLAWGPRRPRRALVLPAIVLGLLGVVFDLLLAVSVLPELVWNENVLVFWALDLTLPLLGPRLRRLYTTVRLVGLAVLVAGHVVGLFEQPLAPLALAALPLVAAWWVARRAVVR